MPLSTYLNLGLGELAHTKLIVELVDRTVKHPKGIAENVLVGIGKFIFPVDFIILDMSEDVKVPLILERSFLSTAHAKIDVFKRKITLRVGKEKIIFKSVKPASRLIKRVYMLSLRERMELDLEARLIGETLILNRSLDLLYGDYIELNDLNEPPELKRNRVDDLEPTIEKALCVEARRFDGIITIRDGDDSVTYQMVWENSRFKHLTNEKCNKIPQLLKMRRSKNGSHAGTLACIRRDEGRAKEKSNLKTWMKIKVLPGRQPVLFLIYFIESVFPDINTAYPLHTIQRIECLDVSTYGVSRTSLEKEIDNVGGVSIIWNPIIAKGLTHCQHQDNLSDVIWKVNLVYVITRDILPAVSEGIDKSSRKPVTKILHQHSKQRDLHDKIDLYMFRDEA
ncbi:putative ribonuclease H-like domain-containing protein [Tanacetum coccineum]